MGINAVHMKALKNGGAIQHRKRKYAIAAFSHGHIMDIQRQRKTPKKIKVT